MPKSNLKVCASQTFACLFVSTLLFTSWRPAPIHQALPISFQGVQVAEDSIINRLNRIEGSIPLVYNRAVKRHLLQYLNNPFIAERDLGLTDVYFPIIEKVFTDYSLPKELAILAIVESRLNTHAVSEQGATGLWQFMPATAAEYGLIISSTVDERRDPFLSTEAAAKCFSRLFDKFEDWRIAMAAFNCGAGNVRKAIRKAGIGDDFEQIKKFLPHQTQRYINKFVAATYLVHYYQEHFLEPAWLYHSYAYSKIIAFEEEIDILEVAMQNNVSKRELLQINPAILTDIIPPHSKAVSVRIPYKPKLEVPDVKDSVQLAIDSIYALPLHPVAEIKPKRFPVKKARQVLPKNQQSSTNN